MSSTQEQQQIIKHVVNNDGLTLVNACAGSGKTFTLVELTKALGKPKGIYICYNKSIATEASRKFPKSVSCKTTHSLAYSNTVKPFNLKLGFFNYRSITEKISYDHKLEVIDNVREFCLSKFIEFEDYAEDRQLTPTITKTCIKYLNLMQEGKIECTHDFYLKLFHILLAHGDVHFDEFDILLLDEAGDLNEVTLEIFLLLPAKKKIAVGDKHQNIYTFNHTINAFSVLEGTGTEFELSKSFRVSSEIASRIQQFCRSYLDPHMNFTGIDYTDKTINSRAYIARTNSSLVDKMIELNQLQTPYGLVRKASDIFKLPLMVCGLTYQGKIFDPAYKHLQSDIDEWFETPALRDQHKSFRSYLAEIHASDTQLVNAIKLVGKHGFKLINQTYEAAKSHESYKCNFTLATVHSVKG